MIDKIFDFLDNNFQWILIALFLSMFFISEYVMAETTRQSVTMCYLCSRDAEAIQEIRQTESLDKFRDNITSSEMSDIDKVMHISISKEVEQIPAHVNKAVVGQLIFNKCMVKYGQSTETKSPHNKSRREL